MDAWTYFTEPSRVFSNHWMTGIFKDHLGHRLIMMVNFSIKKRARVAARRGRQFQNMLVARRQYVS